MHSECEWHADDSACEDAAGHDDHDHGDEAHLEFELTALSVGSTTFTVSVMHDGHADYTSLPILVTVEGEETCVAGDVNSDGDINVIDVVLAVDVILGLFSPEDICAYDFNSDGLINVVDVVQIVQFIVTPALAHTEEAKYIEISKDNDFLSVVSDGFVQGIQMTLIHDDNFSINMIDGFVSEYRTHNNQTILILVNDGSQTITDIATTFGEFKIKDVVTSAKNANININDALVASFELGLVGPNPFNPTTQLNLAVMESGYVNVEVYNLNGQVVASLIDGWLDQNASGHILNFDASLLSSGVYIVRAQSANNISTQKLTLVKQ